MKRMFKNKQDVALLVLRIGLGAIFIFHGYGKLSGGMAGFTGMVDKIGFPLPMVFAYAAALSEFLGGIALLLGIFTDVAAVLVSIVMLVALTSVKKFSLPQADPDFALLAMAVAVYLMGAGRYSLEAFLKSKKEGTAPVAVQPKA